MVASGGAALQAQELATPLATVAVIVGGILMMVSGGNPNLMGLGKKQYELINLN